MFTISRKEKAKEKNKSKKEKLIIGGVYARLGRTEKLIIMYLKKKRLLREIYNDPKQKKSIYKRNYRRPAHIFLRRKG